MQSDSQHTSVHAASPDSAFVLKIKHSNISCRVNFADLTTPPLHKVNFIYHWGRPESYLGVTKVQNSTKVKKVPRNLSYVWVLQPHKTDCLDRKRQFFFCFTKSPLGLHNNKVALLQEQLCTLLHSALLTQYCNATLCAPAELHVNTVFKHWLRSSITQPEMNHIKHEWFSNTISKLTQSKFKTPRVITA